MKEAILRKLNEIQATINVAKNQKNSFGNYNYRSCEDILQALQPYCEKLGVVVLLSDEIKETLNYCYVEATAKIIDMETEEEISVKAQAGIQERKGMDLSQTFGASSSYARKYALNGLFKLDDNKDADTDAFTKATKKEEKGENKDFSIEVKEIDTLYSKPQKQEKKQSQVKNEDLPFETKQINNLEKLRQMVKERVEKLGGDFVKAQNYYAKRCEKTFFEELNEEELKLTINDLDEKLLNRRMQ